MLGLRCPAKEVAAVPTKPRDETPPSPSAETTDASVVTEARKERQLEAEAEAGRDRQAEVAAARDKARQTVEAPPQAGGATAQVLRIPGTVAGAIAGDISSAARRPEAVLYWGGLAGLAALGVLEWPVAAAIGVGVAVASGIRRRG
jgi:hypothetical protein